MGIHKMQCNPKMGKCTVQFVVKNSKLTMENNIIFCNFTSCDQLMYYLSQLLQHKQNIETHTLFFRNNVTFFKPPQNNDESAINFILTLDPNNLVMPHKIYDKFLSNDDHDSESKYVDSVKITLVQYSNQWNQLDRKELSWIKEVYNYYLCHYLNLFITHHPFYSTLYEKKKEMFSNVTLRLYENRNQHDRYNTFQQRENIMNNNINNNNINNNNGNEFERDLIAVGNNRDWLDHFYMISRIVILFSIVYFYSSPSRFIMVTVMGFLIYLYHNGFFQGLRGQPEALMAHNDGRLNNNEIIENNANPPILNRLLPPQQENTRDLPSPTIDNAQHRRPGVLTVTWIFLSSFFASLVPEQANNA